MRDYIIGCVECGKTWKTTKERFIYYLHKNWLFVELDDTLPIDGQMYCNICVKTAYQLQNQIYK